MNDESEEVLEELELIDLTDEQRKKLEDDSNFSEFHRAKLEREAKKNWDLFYKRNGDKFFKNRHWVRREFSELFSQVDDKTNTTEIDSAHGHQLKRVLLEIGCGCGDFVTPLLNTLEQDSIELKSQADSFFIYCCDMSDVAVDILKSKPIYKSHHPARISAFVADITMPSGHERILNCMSGVQADIISLVFVLSALDPSKMEQAVENIHKTLKPGGLVLFRDYAIYDSAMLRFDCRSKISSQFYVRQDGTRSYFFSKSDLLKLFTKSDSTFCCKSIEYIRRKTINNATGCQFSRIFLQAKFAKINSTS